MKNKQIKKSLKIMILLILLTIPFVIFIQACQATPATSITDANEVPTSGGFISVEPILGDAYLSIYIRETDIIVGFTGNGLTATETLSNISGEFGSYSFQNGNMEVFIRFSDENSMRATITSLKKGLSFSLENILCSK